MFVCVCECAVMLFSFVRVILCKKKKKFTVFTVLCEQARESVLVYLIKAIFNFFCCCMWAEISGSAIITVIMVARLALCPRISMSRAESSPIRQLLGHMFDTEL